MGKRPQTEHAKALGAFINGWITEAEYRMCCYDYAWVSGRGIHKPNGWAWELVSFSSRGKVR